MMIAGGKRGRDDDSDLVQDVSTSIQNMSTEIENIVESVGKVNGVVIASILQKAKELENAFYNSCNSTSHLWKLLAQSQQSRAAAALEHLRTAEDAKKKSISIISLQQQLTNSASVAAEEVSKGLDAANGAAVALFSSQLVEEQETNELLVSHVREFLRNTLEALKIYSQRALKADLALSKKELSIARLQSSLAFYQNTSLKHHEEVMALIKIIRLLANKSKDVDLANSKLLQAKAHVKLLEKHLDLSGIANAIIPPSFVPPRPPKDAPNESLRRTAPEYFALRLLEHKDMTLSELIDSWQQQESRILKAEAKYHELEISAAALRKEALTVHQGFLEEKKRREIVEQRLVDLVRERINPSSNDLLVRQLTQLRADYTKVLDDSAQMATTLSITRESLAQEQERNAQLEAKIQQMKNDSDADEVAHTLDSLRKYYEKEIERLRINTIDAETQSAIAVAHAEIQQETAINACDALKYSERTVKEMSNVLRRFEEEKYQNKDNENNNNSSSISKPERLMEESEKILAQSEAHLNKAISSFQSVIQETETQRMKDLTTFEQQVKKLITSFQELQTITTTKSEEVEKSDVTLTLKNKEEEEVLTMMRKTLMHALQFVSDGLVTTESTKTSLMDTFIADARHVSFLLNKIQQVTSERDEALEKLEKCQRLIDEHSLTAVERVLMHEVPVEDSLDANEASEQIAMLQEKVASLNSICDSTVAKMLELKEEMRQEDEQTESVSSKLELLERHNNRLSLSLQECLTREVSLIEQVHKLQHNLKQWINVPENNSDIEIKLNENEENDTPQEENEKENEEEEEEEEKEDKLAERLEQLCEGISEVKAQLVQMQESISTPIDSNNEETSTKVMEAQLLKNGVRQVAEALRGALQHAEYFRHALQIEEKTETTDIITEAITDEKVEEETEIALDTNAAEIKARDDELTRLRVSLENYTRVEESLKNRQEELVQQNTELERKLVKMLDINKRLVEQLKTTRTTNETPAK